MKESQKSMLPHSEAKVELLRKYLEAYIGVLGHDPFTEKIRITDFCCGVGIFENEKHGSPLVIVGVITEFLKRFPENPTNFECHFNDTDLTKVSYLKEIVTQLSEERGDRLVVTFGNENCCDLIPKTLELQVKAGRTKFFHFIDPYGYKDIRWSHLRQLLETGNSEVLLFQPSSFLFRFREKPPEALRQFMDELSPETNWVVGGDLRTHIERTTELFRQQFEKGFVDSFTIEKQKNTVFCLFFFTSHIKGHEKMLEAKWALNESSGKGWHYSAGMADDLFAKIKIPAEVKALKQLILSLFHEGGTVTNYHLYTQTLKAGFLPRHANEILRKLENENRLVKEPVSRRGNFLINYENTYKNPRIVKLSLLQ